jgi:hypothetical protein
VRFSVLNAVATFATPSSGAGTTNASGQVQFCFTASLPGTNVIHAYADVNNNNTQEPTEPFDEATKVWTLPPSASFCEVKVTGGGFFHANNGDRANFGGNAKSDTDTTPPTLSGNEEYQDNGPAVDMNLHSTRILAILCADAQHATIYGEATINGSGTYAFRIDVTDLGEPGTSDTYGIIVSNGYASGQHTLEGGNVQIHKP